MQGSEEPAPNQKGELEALTHAREYRERTQVRAAGEAGTILQSGRGHLM